MTNDDMSIESLEVNGLVDYQTGSIVSRTLLNKASGNVTLFAFDAGESLSEHTTPHDALVFVTDGELQVTLAGDPHTIGPGEALLMPANVPHALEAVTRSKMMLVMIHEQREDAAS